MRNSKSTATVLRSSDFKKRTTILKTWRSSKSQTIKDNLKCSVTTKDSLSTLNRSSRSSWRTKSPQLSQMRSRQLNQLLEAITCHIKRELIPSKAMLIWSSKCKKLNHLRNLIRILEILIWVWSTPLELFLHHLLISMMLELSKRSHQPNQWSLRATLKLLEEGMSARLPPRSHQKEQILRKLMLWENQWMVWILQLNFLLRPPIKLELKSTWTSTTDPSISHSRLRDQVLPAHTELLDSMDMDQLRSIKNWMWWDQFQKNKTDQLQRKAKKVKALKELHHLKRWRWLNPTQPELVLLNLKLWTIHTNKDSLSKELLLLPNNLRTKLSRAKEMFLARLTTKREPTLSNTLSSLVNQRTIWATTYIINNL